MSYNWAAVLACAGLPPRVSSARYEYDYEARPAPIGGLWEAAGQSGKIMDMMVGWARLAAVCAQLSSAPGWLSLHSSLRSAGRGAQSRCAGLSLPLCGLGSRSSLLAWSLSPLYNIAMIWDQCAGRLYTRALPISVLTVPYDSCKLPPASCCYHRLYSDKKRWPGCYGQDTCTSCSKHHF